MEPNSKTSVRTFRLTDGSARLQLGWYSAPQLPDCRAVGMAAARKADGGYEYATVRMTCPVCWSRFTVKPRVGGEAPGPTRTMSKVNLKRSAVVDVSCSDIADALLDSEALAILELAGNVSMDEGDGLYAVCPSCGSAFPATLADEENTLIVRNGEDVVEIECSRGYEVRLMRNGGYANWTDCENDSPDDQLIGMGTLRDAVPGVSAEARHYVDISLGLGTGKPSIPNGVDLLDIAVRNRFRKSYDPQFHQDVKDLVAMVDLPRGSNVHPGSALFRLPRDYSDHVIPEILKANRWPDDSEVRKAVKGRLAIAVLLSHDGAGRICGRDPEVISRLLGSPAVGVDFVYALHDKRTFSEGLGDIFLMAARDEEPGVLVDLLMKMGPDAIRKCLDEYRELRLGRLEAYTAYRLARRGHALEEVLASPRLLGGPEERREDFRIDYTARDRFLCAEGDGYRFSLPATTRTIAAVGFELGDEYLAGRGVQAAFGEKVVVLVASESKFVAAICLDCDRAVVHIAFRKGDHIRKDSKLGRAISWWIKANGVSTGEDFQDEDTW